MWPNTANTWSSFTSPASGRFTNSRAEQIGEDVLIQWERFGTEGLPEIDQRIGRSFEGLLDFFTIQYCPDLNGVMLPPAILKYEKAQPGKTDLWLMIQDFLDFDREQEVFHFEFIAMRADLLANACKNFLFAERKEKILSATSPSKAPARKVLL